MGRAIMRTLRSFLLRHRTLAVLLLVAALSVRALLPQGYMLGGNGFRTLAVEICFDGGAHGARTLAIPLADDRDGQPGEPEWRCPFAVLSLGALSPPDLPIVAALLAFILALGFAPVHAAPLRRARFLQPPTCGPPLSC
jgi:hypothetical protein